LSNFEANGFKVVSGRTNQLNWSINAGGTALAAAPNNPLVCIDPLGITEQGTYAGTFPFNCFFLDGTTPPPVVSMPSVNLGLPNPNPAIPTLVPFSVGEARRMFRLTDDLVFAQANDPTDQDADLNGPQQVFNEAPGGGSLNRQSTGSISWVAIAQPIVNMATAEDIDSYKFHVLVFKDRITDATALESAMEAAVVTSPVAAVNPMSSVTTNVALPTEIRLNDWVMLINSNPALPPGLGTNMAFARVSNLFGEDPATAGYDPLNTTSRLTLDGPNFQFTDPTDSTTPTTYIVHLRDVVAVFSRTIKLETLSEWNVSD